MNAKYARRRRDSMRALALTALAVIGTAWLGTRAMKDDRKTRRWYRRLDKPAFTPPGSVFPPVWTALYTLMALSAWRVARQPDSRHRRRALRLWALQLALNGTWSPLFFGLRKPGAALVDIGLLLPAIGAYTAASRKVDRPAAWMMAPYLAWVGFATVLNTEIVRRNR